VREGARGRGVCARAGSQRQEHGDIGCGAVARLVS
jgi:hypothetical protein